jgi:hypothetical protein
MRDELLTAFAIAAAAAAATGCKRDREQPARQPARAGSALPLPPPLAGSAFYRLDLGPLTPCAAGAPCEARLVLTALGAYKVNRDYPFKFIADPAPGVAVDGTGAFALDDARGGTLTLRFRAARPGPVRLTGTFKLSVCTEEECEIEEPKISFELPIG